MAQALEHQLSQPTYGDLPFEQRLGHLVDAERSHRDSQRLMRLLKNARLKVQAEPEAIVHSSHRLMLKGESMRELNAGSA